MHNYMVLVIIYLPSVVWDFEFSDVRAVTSDLNLETVNSASAEHIHVALNSTAKMTDTTIPYVSTLLSFI